MPDHITRRDLSSSEPGRAPAASRRASGLTVAAVGTTALALAIGAAVVALPHHDTSSSTVAVASSPGGDTAPELAALTALAPGQSADTGAWDAAAQASQSSASHRRREKAIRARLQPLVQDGTISAKQADEIAATLSQHPALWRPGVMGLLGLRHLAVDVTADYLNTPATAVRQQLRSGKSLAEITAAAGKDTKGLVSAMTSKARTALDEAVVAGRLTEARADKLSARLPDLLTRLVNHSPRVRPDDASGTQPAPGSVGGDGSGSGSGSPSGDDLPGLNQLLDAVSA